MDSDPDIEIIEKDSGMSSANGSKDETPERRTAEPPVDVIEPVVAAPSPPAPVPATPNPSSAVKEVETFEDEPDETLAERLWGLTEMFPETVRNATDALVTFTGYSVKGLYKFSCNASWIFFTSSIILFAPVMFETERAQMEEMQKSQQKQVLLGPSSAMSAAGAPPPIQMMR